MRLWWVRFGRLIAICCLCLLVLCHLWFLASLAAPLRVHKWVWLWIAGVDLYFGGQGDDGHWALTWWVIMRVLGGLGVLMLVGWGSWTAVRQLQGVPARAPRWTPSLHGYRLPLAMVAVGLVLFLGLGHNSNSVADALLWRVGQELRIQYQDWFGWIFLTLDRLGQVLSSSAIGGLLALVVRPRRTSRTQEA